jgi:lipopolysaccharide/colanic/teichoic acid biosynthesis glycosyltransferase
MRPTTRLRLFDESKRAFDIIASAVGLVLASPVIAVTAALVRKNLGSPIIFRQERPGKNAHIFTLCKFRSMLEDDPTTRPIADEDRLTSFGRKLRATSLDEIPTLWNVLKGDMSLVGPRPLRVHYLPLYTSDQARRHEVRPGVTGLAQVNGRNGLSWEEKFCLDVEYVNRRSWKLDLTILLKTVRTVIAKEGVSYKGRATTYAFAGSEVGGDER